MTMAELGVSDRPREKLTRHGAGALGSNELLALVLGHGPSGQGALAVANVILARARDAPGLMRLSCDQLTNVPGVGVAQACRVLAALELGRRTLLHPAIRRPRFLSARDAAQFLLPQYGSHPVERFGVMLLDARLRLLATRVVSVGSVDSSLANPREVYREAIAGGASTVVAFHNHPSGDPEPSRDDVTLTLRLKQAGSIIGIELADHVILANDKYCSMKEMRLL
jgi:DNA repair protein RadC